MAENESAVEEAARNVVELPESVSMGVDIVEVERMRAILQRSPSFTRRVFSCEECSYCDGTATPEYHYATRFAAKEAVLKALGTGFAQGRIKPRDIEVVLNTKGKPHVRLYGNAARRAREMGVNELPVSLSYTHSQAVACAMALTNDEQEVKKVDSAQELNRKFKEARSWLDELPVTGATNGAAVNADAGDAPQSAQGQASSSVDTTSQDPQSDAPQSATGEA